MIFTQIYLIEWGIKFMRHIGFDPEEQRTILRDLSLPPVALEEREKAG